MNEQPNIIITPLTTVRWENANERAKDIIRKKLSEPKVSDYRNDSSTYPRGVLVAVGVLIALVALAAFGISVGKEIAASDTIFRVLVSAYPRLSSTYIEVGIIATILLSEVGVLLFGLASHVFSQHRLISRALRLFQGLCVAVALISNITVTALHPVPTAIVFDWFITIAAPVVVIGIGLIVEQLVTTYLENHKQTQALYNAAVRVYREVYSKPETHPEWDDELGRCILEQLTGASKNNKEVIPALIDENPLAREWIVANEYQRQTVRYNLTGNISGNFKKLPGNVSTEQKATPEIQTLSKKDAIQMIRENPALLEIPGAELVEKYGGSTATWSRAKSAFSEVQP